MAEVGGAARQKRVCHFLCALIGKPAEIYGQKRRFDYVALL
jgi:hypothetical protein